MKLKLLFTCFIMSTMYGCSNDMESDTTSIEPVIKSTETSFLQEIQSLEQEGYTVYSKYNLPHYSLAEIEELEKNSINIDDEEALITRDASGAIVKGPYGGTGGYEFRAALSLNSGESWRKLRAIKIYSHKYIVGLQFFWMNNFGATFSSAMYGHEREEGNEYWINLEPEEYIQKIGISHGKYVDRLVVYTYNQTTAQKSVYTYGGTGGSLTTVEIPSDYQIHGFFGRCGHYIDRLGFYAYSNKMFPIE